MSFRKRFYNIITGLIMIFYGILICLDPETGTEAVISILSVSLMLKGVHQIGYYMTMARHMVGGKNIMYRGVLLMDTGLFLLLILDNSRVYATFYLIGGLALSGAISILRGIEARRLQVKSWRITLGTGIIKLVIAATSVFFISSVRVLVYIFVVGLFYSALVRIYEALRKSAIIFVQ